MKPAPFEYTAPRTLDEAVALLAGRHGEAKAIAGGQSLMPILAFRLAAPALLVDLRHLPDLDRIEIGDDGVRLGAKVRWCDIERDARLREAQPLLVAAIKHVAHYQVRNRGTVGGSLAHADPAAEMPGIAVTCDARIHVVGQAGERTVDARDFFLAPLTTVLEPDELIVGVHLPRWRAGRRWAFGEFSRRRGDFALAGVAVFYDVDGQGRVENAHIGVIGANDRPARLPGAEAVLDGQTVDDATIERAAAKAAAEVNPGTDLHAPADYRRALVATLLERALRDAATRTE